MSTRSSYARATRAPDWEVGLRRGDHDQTTRWGWPLADGRTDGLRLHRETGSTGPTDQTEFSFEQLGVCKSASTELLYSPPSLCTCIIRHGATSSRNLRTVPCPPSYTPQVRYCTSLKSCATTRLKHAGKGVKTASAMGPRSCFGAESRERLVSVAGWTTSFHQHPFLLQAWMRARLIAYSVITMHKKKAGGFLHGQPQRFGHDWSKEDQTCSLCRLTAVVAEIQTIFDDCHHRPPCYVGRGKWGYPEWHVP
ncbi:hypothetical protein IWX90DRAFT_257165 [Phyllosticta citrichinensis]|uniref:Uncharacterized protein n=1 Tax=Phyllosticta citrichinensis TaxID=1130410 RepID=A0ABR1XSA0_9PEZI